MSDLLLDDSFDLLVSESDLDGLPETVSANFDLGFDLKNTDELPEPKCQTKVNKPEAQKRFVNLEDTDLDDLAKANSENGMSRNDEASQEGGACAAGFVPGNEDNDLRAFLFVAYCFFY